VRTADFDYELPPELIAQAPAPRRDGSRLLVLERAGGGVEHRRFVELPSYLRSGDVLVLNDSRVIPARLRGFKPDTGGEVEVLLLEQEQVNDWWVMVRPGRRVRVGSQLHFRTPEGKRYPLSATVCAANDAGHRRLRFEGVTDLLEELESVGEAPLPPYIQRPAGVSKADRERYQTVYARLAGSVAAPTAGLHFTGALLEHLRACGVRLAFVTLHVGLGTFAPVKSATLEEHRLHEEAFTLGKETADTVAQAKREGRRVIAVGTTTVRVLESVAALHGGRVAPAAGRTGIFVYPPFRFRVVDALLTNFHLPKSTLLMLVSAFAAPGELRGRELVLAAYSQAVRERYRFFSLGDAMLIV
jgi:S-adenosylmethionine:tRNA ribosyltransferase-isomerase